MQLRINPVKTGKAGFLEGPAINSRREIVVVELEPRAVVVREPVDNRVAFGRRPLRRRPGILLFEPVPGV